MKSILPLRAALLLAPPVACHPVAMATAWPNIVFTLAGDLADTEGLGRPDQIPMWTLRLQTF